MTTTDIKTSMEDRLIIDIKNGIQARVDDAKETFIQNALRQYEKELRDRVGRAAIEISRYFTIEHVGTNLVITVKMEGGKREPV